MRTSPISFGPGENDHRRRWALPNHQPHACEAFRSGHEEIEQNQHQIVTVPFRLLQGVRKISCLHDFDVRREIGQRGLQSVADQGMIVCN